MLKWCLLTNFASSGSPGGPAFSGSGTGANEASSNRTLTGQLGRGVQKDKSTN